MRCVIVEYEFSPPVTGDDLKQMTAALGPCAAVRGIRHVRTVLATDRRRGFCEFEASDADTVRDAFRAAGIAFRSVWDGEIY